MRWTTPSFLNLDTPSCVKPVNTTNDDYSKELWVRSNSLLVTNTYNKFVDEFLNISSNLSKLVSNFMVIINLGNFMVIISNISIN